MLNLQCPEANGAIAAIEEMVDEETLAEDEGRAMLEEFTASHADCPTCAAAIITIKAEMRAKVEATAEKAKEFVAKIAPENREERMVEMAALLLEYMAQHEAICRVIEVPPETPIEGILNHLSTRFGGEG